MNSEYLHSFIRVLVIIMRASFEHSILIGQLRHSTVCYVCKTFLLCRTPRCYCAARVISGSKEKNGKSIKNDFEVNICVILLISLVSVSVLSFGFDSVFNQRRSKWRPLVFARV